MAFEEDVYWPTPSSFGGPGATSQRNGQQRAERSADPKALQKGCQGWLGQLMLSWEVHPMIQGGSYIVQYLEEVKDIVAKLSPESIAGVVDGLVRLRTAGGRLFVLGVGGSAGNAAHAVNDFRKICGIEAYAPTDNVSELTAWINDEGWDSSYANWLRGSRLCSRDAILVLSVGGGHEEKRVSVNLVQAIKYTSEIGAQVFGIVGRDGGYTAQVADACVLVPTVNPATVTPHTEAFQAVVWHLLVSHPALLAREMKWESGR
jgi:D-sedoheptulose 7-phosphate isomerase